MATDTPLVTALDFADPAAAEALAARLDPAATRLKVGKQLFTLAGPALVERLQRRGFEVFLDLKFHDIPHTVAGAVAAATSLGAWMVNVHASGGPRMLDAAREAVARATPGTGTRLIGVTVLTSDSDADLAAVGIDERVEDRVLRLAGLVASAGLDGVVCSAAECRALRPRMPGGFLLVTPGIRPAGVDAHDQRRTVTPAEAIAAGSDHLVVGRAVTGADDPAEALEALAAEVRRATDERAGSSADPPAGPPDDGASTSPDTPPA